MSEGRYSGLMADAWLMLTLYFYANAHRICGSIALVAFIAYQAAAFRNAASFSAATQ